MQLNSNNSDLILKQYTHEEAAVMSPPEAYDSIDMEMRMGQRLEIVYFLASH